MTTAETKIRKAIKKLEHDGEHATARTLRQELAKALLGRDERARQANPAGVRSRFGPGSTPLLKGTHTLGDDPTIGGV